MTRHFNRFHATGYIFCFWNLCLFNDQNPKTSQGIWIQISLNSSRWGSRGYMPLAVGSHFLRSHGVKATLQVPVMSSVYFMHYTFPSSMGLRTEVEASFQGVRAKPSSMEPVKTWFLSINWTVFTFRPSVMTGTNINLYKLPELNDFRFTEVNYVVLGV